MLKRVLLVRVAPAIVLLISIVMNSYSQTVPEAWLQKGDELYRQKKYDAAIEQYDKAIVMKKDFIIAYINKGQVLEFERKFPEAIDNYNELLKIIPGQMQVLTRRGICKVRIKDTSGIKELNESILLDSTNFETYYNRGLGKIWVRDTEGAIKDFQKAIELNPDFGESYFRIGFIKLQLRDFNQACTYLKQALDKGYKRAQDLVDQFCK